MKKRNKTIVMTHLTTAYGYQGRVNLYSVPQGYGISTSAIENS